MPNLSMNEAKQPACPYSLLAINNPPDGLAGRLQLRVQPLQFPMDLHKVIVQPGINRSKKFYMMR